MAYGRTLELRKIGVHPEPVHDPGFMRAPDGTPYKRNRHERRKMKSLGANETKHGRNSRPPRNWHEARRKRRKMARASRRRNRYG